MSKLDEQKLIEEVACQTSRSGGKGGQNVNKVSSKVELNFDVLQSRALTDSQKQIILQKLASRINAEGILRIISQEARTQLQNKKRANEKFLVMIKKALVKKKKRIPTAIPESVKEERLNEKMKISEKKMLRKRSEY